MSFDPAADPWGAAMLAAAGLWGVSVLLVGVATVRKTPRRGGGRLMLVSLVAFLGAAVGGTRARIQAGDASSTTEEDEPTMVIVPQPDLGAEGSSSETDGDTGGSGSDTGDLADTDGAVTDGAVTDGAGTGESGETDTDTGDTEGTDEGTDEPEEPTGSKVPVIAPLPTDPDERDREIRARLRQASSVASDRRRCSRLEEVAEAWAKLRSLPPEGSGRQRAEAITEQLDECRRKLLYSISRRHRRTLVDGRDAFVDEITERLEKEHGLRVVARVSGMSHEKLRIGGSGLDADKAEELMAGKLHDDIVALAFAQVVLSDTKTAKIYEFEVTPENELGLPDMREVGLGEPLELPKAP